MKTLVCLLSCAMVASGHVVARYNHTTALRHHPTAVFMAVAPAGASHSSFVAFYRTSYDSYQTGVSLLDSELNLTLDLGTLIHKCEDPRVVVFNGRILVFDNHGWLLHTVTEVGAGRRLRITVPWRHGSGQKNWVPFIHDGALHIAYTIDPLCVMRCTESIDEFSCTPTACAEEPMVGSVRGTSAAVALPSMPGYIVGLAHNKTSGDSARPMLYRIKMPDMARAELVDIRTHGPQAGITEPTSIVELRDGRVFVTVTQSALGWNVEQDYTISWFQLDVRNAFL